MEEGQKEKRFQRQEDIVRPSQLIEPITIVGAGGIGSWAGLYLAKLGCTEITVFDGDKVEEHNLPSQFYAEGDIGRAKVVALKERIKEFSGVEIVAVPENCGNHFLKGIVVIAVDNMEARIDLAKKALAGGVWKLVIDGRMGGDQVELYTADNLEDYKKTLVDPREVEKDPCTGRSVVYNTAIIGGLIANQVKKFAKGDKMYRSIVIDLRNLTIHND